MAASEERMLILNMVQEGKISAEEGIRLLEALEKSGQAAAAPRLQPKVPPRWLIIRVIDLASGKPKVNVRLPVNVLNAGMRIGAKFSTDLGEEEMSQVIHALRSGERGKIVDITDEEDNEHIEIHLE